MLEIVATFMPATNRAARSFIGRAVAGNRTPRAGVQRAVKWVAVLVGAALLVAGCDTGSSTTVIADCVAGAHHPDGRRDKCVPDQTAPRRQGGSTAACTNVAYPETVVELRLVTLTTNPIPGTITATSSTGQACTVAIDSTGSADLKLRPGTYTVTGRSPNFNRGTQECRAAQTVTFTQPPPPGQATAPEPLRIVMVDCQGA